MEGGRSSGEEEEEGEQFVEREALNKALDVEEQEAFLEGEKEDGDDGGDDHGSKGMVEMVDDSVQGFFEHKDACFAAAVNGARPHIAATGGADDRAFLWHTGTGERIAELNSHADSVADLGFNFDGTLCATAGLDGIVNVWSVDDGKLVQKLEGPTQGVSWIRWHPKGNALLGGSEDCSAWLWLAPQNKTIAVFMGHTAPVECGSFTSDGKLCITGGADSSVRVWKPKEGVCAHVIEGHAFHQAPVVSLAVSPAIGSGLIVSGDEEGGLFLSNVEGQKKGAFVGHTDSVEAICLSSTSLSLMASGSMDGTLRVWDMGTLSNRQTITLFEKEAGGVNQLLWHPSQPLLLGATTDGKIRLWDARSLNLVRQWRGPTATINGLAVSSDWSSFISADDSGAALVFDILHSDSHEKGGSNSSSSSISSSSSSSSGGAGDGGGGGTKK